MIKKEIVIRIYRNREWLQNKYTKNKLSERQIAKLCGFSKATIHRWLKRLDIITRSIGEGKHLRKGNHCILSLEAIEWINGELLGDGCLQCRRKYSAEINYSSKYFEYINYITNTLKSFGIEQSGKIRRQLSKKSNTYFFAYKSRTYESLLSIYGKWYPKGKKIIPRDLELTPLICRQWYIGDGYLRYPNDSNPCIILATNNFVISDVDWLAKQLNKINIKANRTPSNNTIHISTNSTDRFLKYIGKCPVRCYQYKFWG